MPPKRSEIRPARLKILLEEWPDCRREMTKTENAVEREVAVIGTMDCAALLAVVTRMPYVEFIRLAQEAYEIASEASALVKSGGGTH